MSQQQFFNESNIPLLPDIQFIQGNTGGPVGPDPVTHIINIIGNTVQGVNISGNAGTYTETVTVTTATTTQLGVNTVATTAQAIAGTDNQSAVTSLGLADKLGSQTLNGLAYGTGTTTSLGWLGEATDGQLPIGSTGNPPSLGFITSTGGTIDWTFGPGTINGEVVEPTQVIALNYINVTNAMSPYTVTATDYYISVDSSGGPVTILLPNTTTFKREFIVKDRLGLTATNDIVLTTPGGIVTIDGTAIYTFTDDYESAEIIFNGSSYETF